MNEKEIEMMMEMKSDIAGIKGILQTMANTNDIAIKAFESSKSAHRRLNAIDKIIFWAGTTVIGALIVGAVALLFKLKGVGI